MKENLKNQIISELSNAFTGKQLQLIVTIERIDIKNEKVTISYANEDLETPKDLITKTTKNGFAWVAGLLLTVCKIKWLSTNVLIFNNAIPY